MSMTSDEEESNSRRLICSVLHRLRSNPEQYRLSRSRKTFALSVLPDAAVSSERTHTGVRRVLALHDQVCHHHWPRESMTALTFNISRELTSIKRKLLPHNRRSFRVVASADCVQLDKDSYIMEVTFRGQLQARAARNLSLFLTC